MTVSILGKFVGKKLWWKPRQSCGRTYASSCWLKMSCDKSQDIL